MLSDERVDKVEKRIKDFNKGREEANRRAALDRQYTDSYKKKREAELREQWYAHYLKMSSAHQERADYHRRRAAKLYEDDATDAIEKGGRKDE